MPVRAIPRTDTPAGVVRQPLAIRPERLSRPYFQNFETGSNGSNFTIPNSGGQTGPEYDDAWVSFGTTIPTYANTTTHRDALAMSVFEANGGTATSSAGWRDWNNRTIHPGYGRIYFWMSANPTSGFQLVRVIDRANNIIGGVRLTATGNLQALATGTAVGANSAAVPLSQWIRVEYRIIPDLLVGEVEVRAWWTDPESTGATDFTSNNVAPQTMGGQQIDGTRYGICNAPAAFTADFTMYLDDITGNMFDWPGPVVPTRPRINPVVVGQAVNRAVTI